MSVADPIASGSGDEDRRRAARRYAFARGDPDSEHDLLGDPVKKRAERQRGTAAKRCLRAIGVRLTRAPSLRRRPLREARPLCRCAPR
jgi:hypothetical protein